MLLVHAVPYGQAIIETAFAESEPRVLPSALDPIRLPRKRLAEQLCDPSTWHGLTKKAQGLAKAWKAISTLDMESPVRILQQIEQSLALPRIAAREGADVEAQYLRTRAAAYTVAANATSTQQVLASFERATEDEPEERAIRIQTMHGVKGLEARHIWAVRWNDGTFPIRSASAGEPLDEERRVAFTAITRARRTFAASATRFDATHAPLRLSRFVTEAGLVEIHHDSTAPGANEPRDTMRQTGN